MFVYTLKGNRLELSAPNVSRYIVHDRTLACTDPGVKRSNPYPNLGLRLALRGKWLELEQVQSKLTFAWRGLHVDTTAYFSTCCLQWFDNAHCPTAVPSGGQKSLHLSPKFVYLENVQHWSNMENEVSSARTEISSNNRWRHSTLQLGKTS